MCGMCGIWGNAWHWTIAAAPVEGTSNGRPRMAMRAEQGGALQRVASLQHVKVRDWSGTCWIVEGPSGNTEIVETLPQIWESVERVSGTRLDPLSDAFIDAFSPSDGQTHRMG